MPAPSRSICHRLRRHRQAATATFSMPASRKPAPSGSKPSATASTNSALSAQNSTGETLGPASDLTSSYTPWDVPPSESRPRIITIITPTAPPSAQQRGIRPLARNLHGTSSSYARSTARGGGGRVFTPMHSTAPAPALTAARRPRNRAMFATSSLSRRVPTENILGFDLRKFACPTLALVRRKQRSCGDDAGHEPLFFHSPCFSPPFPLRCHWSVEIPQKQGVEIRHINLHNLTLNSSSPA